ncbi:hypothetical protein [Novosphingobium sp.]|uniref:hypothetical protein n=1 Tax=Novosphingobium sp. TaxID=1874826 RepID=UPI002631FCFC|nr:hypothetical protein [Novosphingobium sp.]
MSPAEAERAFLAIASLQAGDPEPMIGLLRGGGPFPAIVATTLAEMLEGTHPKRVLHLIGVRRPRGRPRRRALELRRRDRAIASRVEALRTERQASVIKLVAAEFGLPAKEVQRALAHDAEAMEQLRRFLSGHRIAQILRGRVSCKGE